MIGITTSQLYKVLNHSILSLLILFFIGSLEFMPDVYSSRPMFDLPAWMEGYWNSIPSIILAF